MKSRRAILSILALTMLLLISTGYSPVTASEPSDMSLVYDYGLQSLSVNVSHYVSNTKTHYIDKIEIQKNGLSVLNRSYANQSENWGVYDTFSVSASVGDNITVTANCKKGYSITRWLIATSGTATNPPTTGTTTSTTDPTNGGDVPASLGGTVAIVAGVGVVVSLIAFFAWLEPDRFRGLFKNLGPHARAGVTWFGEKLSNILQQIRTRLPSK
ncbi:MAG: hypothetical protein ACFFCP_11680 [Promethearchaeota archaeon]